MTVDTGATSGLVTESVATALLVRGDATEIEGGNSTIADGCGGMLFGLLPLSQFGRFTIDPANSLLVFG
jgi:hypothetical protein